MTTSSSEGSPEGAPDLSVEDDLSADDDLAADQPQDYEPVLSLALPAGWFAVDVGSEGADTDLSAVLDVVLPGEAAQTPFRAHIEQSVRAQLHLANRTGAECLLMCVDGSSGRIRATGFIRRLICPLDFTGSAYLDDLAGNNGAIVTAVGGLRSVCERSVLGVGESGACLGGLAWHIPLADQIVVILEFVSPLVDDVPVGLCDIRDLVATVKFGADA